MGAFGDLTTLAAVKAWRSPPVTTTADDAAIARIVTAASAFIRRYLERNLASASYAETRNGTGGTVMMLRHAPATSLATLTVDGSAIAAGAGYVLDGPRGVLHLRGHVFRRGVQNVAVVYTAGYLASGEAQAVPAAAPYALACSNLQSLWASDADVAYQGGAALAPVAQGTQPNAGQYVPPGAPDGAYLFAAADAGKAIAVSYGLTPRDVEQACIELVLLRLNERGRIGEVSKTQAGEVVSFVQKDLTPSVVTALAPYRRVVPMP